MPTPIATKATAKPRRKIPDYLDHDQYATVTVIEPNPNGAPRDWQVREWNTDIELMDGHIFNIARYLADKGIVVDD